MMILMLLLPMMMMLQEDVLDVVDVAEPDV
jgi:hypothetical protein